MVVGGQRVRFAPSSELWQGYDELLLELARRNDVRSVAELGGGARPLIGDSDKWGFVSERVVIDISADELAKAGDSVEKRVADLCSPMAGWENSYDLVFSKMLCEHLPDAHSFHTNCFNMLRPGGLSVHFFPTLYSTPFLLNRILPENLTRSILRRVQPRRLENPKSGKFPALYRWCSGPTQRNLDRYKRIGYEIEQWTGGFGHKYYRRLPPLQALEDAKARFLIGHPLAPLTSYAVVVFRKPTSGGLSG